MKTKSLLMMVAVFLLAMFGTSLAGSIRFKDGNTIQTLGTWEEGDKVYGFVNGQVKSFPKEDVESWSDSDVAESVASTRDEKTQASNGATQFGSVQEMIDNFLDYPSSNGRFILLQQSPLHIQLSPLVVPGDTVGVVKDSVNMTLLYGVYRAFIHTPVERIKVTAVPLEYNIKTKRERYLLPYQRTITVNREKALALVKKYLPVKSFADLVTTTSTGGIKLSDQWIKEWSRVYYSNNEYPGQRRFVNELSE
jgi:hypothetical protein